MTDMTLNTTTLRQRARRNGGGIGGCAVGCLATLALIMVIIGLGAYFVSTKFTAMLDLYTATAAVQLPASTLSEEETKSVWDRVEGFKEAIEKGQTPPTLELTADQINALLLSAPASVEIGNWIHVDIKDDKVLGEVSLDLGKITPLFAGRYFNGTVKLDVRLEHNILYVFAEEASVKDLPVPEQIMGTLSKQNLAEQMQMDERARDYMKMIETIKVEDGVIKITPVSTTIVPEDSESPTAPDDQPVSE